MDTTFWMDFSIADVFGIKAIEDTYRRAFKEWKTDYRYLTELVIVLNEKIWSWYGKDEEKAKLYDKLWRQSHDYALDHLKGDEFSYYYDKTN